MKVGTVVTLKSGGPKMTVTNFDNDKRLVAVAWFDDAELKTVINLNPDTLTDIAPDRAAQGKP